MSNYIYPVNAVQYTAAVRSTMVGINDSMMQLVQLLHLGMAMVIDTSALLAVLLNEKHKPVIIEATKGYDLQAPISLDAEIGNALSALFKRQRLSLKEAEQVLVQLTEIPIRRSKLRLKEAIKLAHLHNIYAYDAYILDCARQYRSPLLSLDKKLIKIGKKLELNLVEVSK